MVLGRLCAYYHFKTKITRKCGNNIEFYNIENVGAGEAETGALYDKFELRTSSFEI